MTLNQPKMFAPSKVNLETQKVKDYIAGENIYPTTVELDLTQLCVRSCPGCPYSVARREGLTLQLPFLDRLFSIIGPNTPGIVLTGGEATIVPHFPEVIALAKKRGFKTAVVISNGANIHLSKVQDALLEHARAIRISMYDWQKEDSDWFLNTLHKIEGLRNRIEKEGSSLEIGASILTQKKWNHRYESVGQQAFNAGINWLYFHPYCIDWDKEYPTQADQSGVMEAVEKVKETSSNHGSIQIPVERYEKDQLYFEKLHGSHFLLQVGADGINYAGPECKYEKEAELLDLNDNLVDDFMWHPQRLKRINAINSDNYRFIGTKHRPPMFSDYVQKLIHFHNNDDAREFLKESPKQFKHPNII